MQVNCGDPADDVLVNVAANLPGVLSAQRLLSVGCSETTVMHVLMDKVGLTVAEASAALDLARAAA